MTNEVAAGSPHPLGATVVPGGVNFSVYSKSAEKIELLLFDSADAGRPARVVTLDPEIHRTYHYWHVFVPQVKPGPSADFALIKKNSCSILMGAARPFPALTIGRRPFGPATTRPWR